MRILYIVIISMLFLSCSKKSTDPTGDTFSVKPFEPAAVNKSNDMKIYMHYMPWFQSKEINGSWGIHWTMATRNPDIEVNGKRQIASHFYPLIGPYSSMDSNVIEYHLLLMKLSGIDGVLIDWYGSHDVNDYRGNLINSEALVDQLDETGLTFGIVYEEVTAANVAEKNPSTSDIQAAQADMIYLKDQYFNNSQYISINGDPLLLTFGPRHFKTENEWTEIFSVIETDPVFMPLWNFTQFVGSHADGEFAWVGETLSRMTDFYEKRAPQLDVAMASAYPGFLDYYQQGGLGDGFFQVAYNGTGTLTATLNRAAQSGLSMLQLVTWNDFGEGTMIEPTVEFGYDFLTAIQNFTGVPYDQADLETVYRLYEYRKNYTDDADVQLKLDQVFYYLVSLQIDQAVDLLNEIDE